MEISSQLATLAYWNALVKAHLPELLMVLTAAVVVVLDRYLRRSIAKMTGKLNVVARFGVFLLVCTLGYTALALGVHYALSKGVAFNGGLYAAPGVLAILLLVAVEAQRQKQM